MRSGEGRDAKNSSVGMMGAFSALFLRTDSANSTAWDIAFGLTSLRLKITLPWFKFPSRRERDGMDFSHGEVIFALDKKFQAASNVVGLNLFAMGLSPFLVRDGVFVDDPDPFPTLLLLLLSLVGFGLLSFTVLIHSLSTTSVESGTPCGLGVGAG